jgi:hypothetical protein
MNRKTQRALTFALPTRYSSISIHCRLSKYVFVFVLAGVLLTTQPSRLLKLANFACIACGARIRFHQIGAPRIDACGFESYQLECVKCATRLAGVVDPYDDALIVSAADVGNI